MAYLINGRSLSDLVWQSLDLNGHVAPSHPTYDRIELANGASALTPTVQITARTIRLTVELRPPTLAYRVATRDALARRLAGLVLITTTDAPDRAWRASLSDVGVDMPAGPVVNPLCVIDLTFTVHDPRASDIDTMVRVLSATPVQCPTGTAVSAPVIDLFGNGTPIVNPVVTLSRFDGQVMATLTLTGSLGANTWLRIDCATEWMHLYTSGTRTTALGWLASGTFPLLSSEDAADVAGPFPRLSLSSASGTPTGVVRWSRVWA